MYVWYLLVIGINLCCCTIRSCLRGVPRKPLDIRMPSTDMVVRTVMAETARRQELAKVGEERQMGARRKGAPAT